MVDGGGKDRRRHKRIKMPFMIRFRILPGEGEEASPEWNMVTARNLGAGGVLFNYDKRIRLDTNLEMKISFPAFDAPIECRGRVIRVEEPRFGGNIYHLAVVFTEIDEKDKNILDRAAEELNERGSDKIEE